MVAKHRLASTVCVGAALVVAACGDSASKTDHEEPGPIPTAMCPERAWPMAAAYDLKTGAFRWAACVPGGGLFLMAAASEDTVWVVESGGREEYVAIDAHTGDQLWRGDHSRFRREVPADSDQPVDRPPVLDGVQLSGGQDDPMTGTDTATGATIWTQPGHMVYDDSWAVGDGAVFAVESDFVPNDPKPPALAAYEVATGDVRWRRELTEPPWHVTGERLLAMWNNLEVVATNDGTVQWETHYPQPSTGFPRMMGGLANSQSVFVSFTTVWSGGD